MVETKTVRATVHGLVQGVGFRFHTRKTAIELDIRGTVRNLPSGEVEIYAEGSFAALDKFLTWLQRGPALSRVSRVDVENVQLELRTKEFSIIG